jgi:hypothetical protein
LKTQKQKISKIVIENEHFQIKRNKLFENETLFLIACSIVILIASVYYGSDDNMLGVAHRLIPDTNIQR